MRGPFPKLLKPPVELTTKWLNQLRAIVLRNQIELGPNSGLAMLQTPTATVLRLANSVSFGQLVVTDGTITARVGTTAGTGTVFATTFNGTTITTTGVEFTVYSYSSTTGGIPTGSYCWMTPDEAGYLWVVSVDCGN
jgi:hypothetical protein